MIVTHTNPDMDAITSVWLLKRFGGLENADVKFVNTGNPDPAILARAVAVVDTGKEYNPQHLRFDHHHLPGRQANGTCAAWQVYDHLCLTLAPDAPLHLRPLIDLVFAGDTGRIEAHHSRRLGLHALFSGYKIVWLQDRGEGESIDYAALYHGFMLLDHLGAFLHSQAMAVRELEQAVVYRSDDNMVWAIRHGGIGTTFAAYGEGARIVIFEAEPIELDDAGATYPIGISRAAEWQEPHVGELVERVAKRNLELADEISTWFKHPAGFFSGRGTGKAPDSRPVTIDLVELARAFDKVWKRR